MIPKIGISRRAVTAIWADFGRISEIAESTSRGRFAVLLLVCGSRSFCEIFRTLLVGHFRKNAQRAEYYAEFAAKSDNAVSLLARSAGKNVIF